MRKLGEHTPFPSLPSLLPSSLNIIINWAAVHAHVQEITRPLYSIQCSNQWIPIHQDYIQRLGVSLFSFTLIVTSQFLFLIQAWQTFFLSNLCQDLSKKKTVLPQNRGFGLWFLGLYCLWLLNSDNILLRRRLTFACLFVLLSSHSSVVRSSRAATHWEHSNTTDPVPQEVTLWTGFFRK